MVDSNLNIEANNPLLTTIFKMGYQVGNVYV
jgi:hypothetical protein